jgi:hypothetical protein
MHQIMKSVEFITSSINLQDAVYALHESSKSGSLYILLLHCFEVPITWGDPSASNPEIYQIFSLESFIILGILKVLLAWSKLRGKIKRDLRWRTNISGDFGCLRLHLLQDLDSGGAVTNRRDSFVLPVQVFVPVGTVHKFASERVQPLDVGPVPFIQNAGTMDKNMCFSFDDFAALVYSYFPSRSSVIPDGGGHSGIEPHMLIELIFFRHPLHVLPNFTSRCVERCPVWIWFEG